MALSGKLNRIARTLLQQCVSEGLTIFEAERVAKQMVTIAYYTSMCSSESAPPNDHRHSEATEKELAAFACGVQKQLEEEVASSIVDAIRRALIEQANRINHQTQ